ncbi:MAG TPA: hypothetical protein VKG78_11455 [Opitutaceae bacterium]|nr:hypothetical protein [Opitutaceae bacterium]
MTPPPLRLVVSLLALLTAGANPAPAADLPPEAASVLRAAAEAYKALPAYADRGKVVVTISAGGREERRTTAMTLEFVRPNRLVFDAGVLALVCDSRGTRLVSFSRKRAIALPPASSLAVAPGAQANPADEANRVLTAARRFFDDATGPDQALAAIGSVPESVVLTFLLEADPVATLAARAGAIRRGSDRQLDAGALAPVVHLNLTDGPALMLIFDPQTRLLARVEVVVPGDEGASIAWTAGDVETDPARVARALEAHAAAVAERRERAAIADPGHRGSVRAGSTVVPTPSGQSITGWIKALLKDRSPSK